MSLDLPADAARVVRTWSPDSLSRLGRGPAPARTVAVLAAPGLDQEAVGAVVTSAGWSVRPVCAASAVLVLVDPALPPGGALVRAARSIPADLPVVLRIAAGPDDARRVLARWAASVPRADAVVVCGPDDDAIVDALARAADRVDPAEAERTAVDRALAEARTALTAAARRDTGSADLADARERRRRAASIATDDGLLLRRSRPSCASISPTGSACIGGRRARGSPPPSGTRASPTSDAFRPWSPRRSMRRRVGSRTR
ncbi:hypothetical protein [Rhodococcus sp. NBC_00294]|uniref:hypothetical protein n=1 Tax=Rhodococcus sp. NBC_00294 TaxID=2976004 RepID=UPI002E2E68AD|nr:hypothetical protein [Rhodococcus sp. NBC_00294]